MKYVYYLLLGANLGDRQKILSDAMSDISSLLGEVIEKSSIYETEPWGLTEQPMFLNQAISIKSDKAPVEALKILKSIETKYGVRSANKYDPRYLDIDILYCDDQIVKTTDLTIPHPELYNRNFVLVPLMEIAGDYEDPVLHIRVDDIYDQCKDKRDVFLYDS